MSNENKEATPLTFFPLYMNLPLELKREVMNWYDDKTLSHIAKADKLHYALAKTELLKYHLSFQLFFLCFMDRYANGPHFIELLSSYPQLLDKFLSLIPEELYEAKNIFNIMKIFEDTPELTEQFAEFKKANLNSLLLWEFTQTPINASKIENLLNEGANANMQYISGSIEKPVKSNGTPILALAANKGVKFVKILIGHGANIHACDREGLTVIEHLEKILQQADVNKDKYSLCTDTYNHYEESITHMKSLLPTNALTY